MLRISGTVCIGAHDRPGLERLLAPIAPAPYMPQGDSSGLLRHFFMQMIEDPGISSGWCLFGA